MINRLARLLCALVWVFALEVHAGSKPRLLSNLTQPNTYPDENQRYLCVALLNTTEGDQFGLDVIREAAKQGCNASMITVRWDVVYKSPTEAANWKQYDNQIKLSKELGLKIFIRVHLARCCNRHEGYWTERETSRDQQGNPTNEFFSMANGAVVEKALNFVKEVCERYASYQREGDILCVAATTTPTQEAGYHYEGNTKPGGSGTTSYLSMFDYAPSMVTGYRQWLKQRYTDIKTINAAWRSDFSSINDIQPITTDYPHPENKRYSDWYLYRHSVLKNFLDGVSRTVKSVDNSYKVVNDFGSVHDGLSFRRGTLAFKDLARLADGTKINDSQYYSHYFSADVLRSNMPEGKWIMNEAFHEPNLSSYRLQLMLNEHFERGCKLVNIVSSNLDDVNFYSQGIKFVAAKWLNKPMTKIVPVQKMVVKLSELVRTGGYFQPGYNSRWDEKKASGPVEVKLIEDLLGEPENNQIPVVKNPLENYTIVAGFDASYTIPQGAFQDPDGTIEFYEVSGLPAGLFFDKNTIKGSSTKLGTYEVKVKATDMYDASVTTTFNLTVMPQKVTRLDLYKAGDFQKRSLIRALKNNDTLNLSELNYAVNFFAVPDVSTKALVMRLSGALNKTQIETTAPYGLYGDNDGVALKVGNYELVLEAYNSTIVTGATGIGKITYNFVVIDKRINQAPVLITPIPEQQATVGRAYSYTIPTASFQDKDGEINRIEIKGLPNGLRAEGWKISGTPTQTVNSTVSVEVFDNENASIKTQFVLKVSVTNQVPTVVATIPNQATVVQQAYTYTLPVPLFKDEDGTIVSITAGNIPTGITLNQGKLSGTPAVAGEFVVVIRGTDNSGSWVETSFRLTVKLTDANLPPTVIEAIPNQSGVVGQNFSFTLPIKSFRDPEGGEIRAEAVTLPPGLSNKNGVILGTPTVGGEYKITVRGYDPLQLFAEASFLLTIRLPNGNIPPTVVAGINDQTIVIQQPYSFTVPVSTFYEPDGFLSGIVVRGLPPGLVYQGGRISGTPTVTGSFTIRVRAIDNRGAAVEAFFVLKVTEPPGSSLVFSLFRAGGSSSRRFVQTLRDKDKIALSQIPSFVNIFAESTVPVDRIQFEMSGPINASFTDVMAPYALFDDNGGFGSTNGMFVLTAKGLKSGKQVAESTIEFEITNGGGGGFSAEEALWSPYPNPFKESFRLTLPLDYVPAATSFSLLNLSGQKIPVNDVLWEGQRATIAVQSRSLERGLYFVQIHHPEYPVRTLKILKAE
ncbi:putative Ig domain-containing protein [Runella slithyformis]|uniref:Ig family protein n=1 Tax=Runella slithyformis (strain ATCC 29530 / DSM 19594 / LMG 11500 / NCIMB 11436 / LSU 4) TaxID=761193 RepID=A0A7U3ZN12_RUNSL|nr:putative Ig domain-containing protein [Runella slithyformis]AEI50226.1 Ig family protein [Runella slithyformis DSM 19594]